MPYSAAQQVNLLACSPSVHLMLRSREAVNTNFKVIGLTRLGIKPMSTAAEAYALTTRPSDLFKLPSGGEAFIQVSECAFAITQFNF